MKICSVKAINRLLVGLLLLSVSHTAFSRTPIVTAHQVNGTWESRDGIFLVWALGQQKLKVEFSGVYEYLMGNGEPMANAGFAQGVAHIEGDTAKFYPNDNQDCQLVLRFVKQRLKVSTVGGYAACGFGVRVRADGVYRKTSSKKPKFNVDGL